MIPDDFWKRGPQVRTFGGQRYSGTLADLLRQTREAAAEAHELDALEVNAWRMFGLCVFVVHDERFIYYPENLK